MKWHRDVLSTIARTARWRIGLLGILAALTVGLAVCVGFRRSQLADPVIPSNAAQVVAAIAPFKALDNGRWIRSFRASNGTIYFRGRLLSRDGGRSVGPQPGVNLEDVNAAPERAVLARPGLFCALDGPVDLVRPGTYQVRGWRSEDDLRSLGTEIVQIDVPEGPRRNRAVGEWFGLYVYRTIIEMPDGSWLMTMYGNFDQDTQTPPDRSSQSEVKYMMRAFVVSSRDKGRSWQYLSTIAAPRRGDPIGEGFVEPAFARLPVGRLVCVLRTGHHYPLYVVWSRDGGKTWTDPVYTGLDRGADPCLITLADGRLALSWGRRYLEGWSRLDSVGDAKRFVYPGDGVVNLALSVDGGGRGATNRLQEARAHATRRFLRSSRT